MGHAAFGCFLLLRSEPLQRQRFLYLSICLITVFDNKKVHIVKVGKAVRTTLVTAICLLQLGRMRKQPFFSHILKLEARAVLQLVL
jgi:hypothetical protein